MKILLLSHGSLAVEYIKTAKMILGEFDNVQAIELLEGEDIERYEADIKNVIDHTDEVLILTDLLGGSPFITSCKIYRYLSNNKKIRLVTGMNLPMILEVLNTRDNCTMEESANVAEEFGKKGIVNFFKQMEGGN
ncbi:PTS system mannose-specific EIIAB component [bioreactor metagenome]|uniref:PTS system mannose-specific EIIAB component n=1 Tax=bioreactor metagenome TaxID=1076179 RepID=A0A645AYH4_9ZZZZ|nr:PTS sugar transporter subunit IIA [Erysipelotrichaceae bacterium]